MSAEPDPLPEMRTGRTLGRTLYLRTGGDDWKADTCIGIVDTPELAEAIVAAVNGLHAAAGTLAKVSKIHRKSNLSEHCVNCRFTWPCPTRCALDGA